MGKAGPALLIALAALMTTTGRDARAADIDRLSGSAFFLVTQGTPMRDVIRDFASNYGVAAVVSSSVTDTFVGTLRRATPRQTLEALSRDYGLAWYLSGNALYVYKAQQARDTVITPTWLNVNDLITRLQSAGILSSPFCQATAMTGLNSIDVFGVPQCLERVSELVRSVDVNARKSDENDQAIEVFPLKYASANDAIFNYRDQQLTVPGVVTELRELSQDQSLPVQNPGALAAAIPLPSSGATATSTGMVGLPPLPPGNIAYSLQGEQLPLFAADIRQNAVIVRDHKANMPIYRALIPQLDKKPVQIEISVDIIDVDAGDLTSIGSDFSASANVGGNGVSFNGGAGSFSTVVNSSGRSRFLERITALETSAKARILSRPSVVTLNNVQAVLDRNITFYAKLQGRDVAKLQSVSAGSLLRVTPRMVDGRDEQEIILTLDIQDGQQQGASGMVDSLPQIQNSSISTQAILRPGQSLLLGGFIQKEDISSRRRIPWLAAIPLLGGLFRSSTDAGQSVVRLFLIKARPLPGMLQDDTVETGSDGDAAISLPPVAVGKAMPPVLPRVSSQISSQPSSPPEVQPKPRSDPRSGTTWAVDPAVDPVLAPAAQTDLQPDVQHR